MRSASICLVLKGRRQGEVQEGSGRGGQRAKGKWTLPQVRAARDAQDEE